MPDTSGPTLPNGEPRRFTFRARHRLTHARQFKAVYDAKMRKARGSVVVFTRPNGLPHHRLGLAVSARTIPKAVDRNRLKRLIREWFRLNHHDQSCFPEANPDSGGLDLIVSVRSARPVSLDSLWESLNGLVSESLVEWRRRSR